MASLPVDVLEQPSLNEFKRVELYKNYRALIPIQFRDILCPKPPKWVFDKVANDKKQTKDSKKRKLEDVKEGNVKKK